jgi:LPXTG-motif cell wall-anchored protein
MDTATLTLVLIVAGVLVIAAAWWFVRRRRRRAIRERFGPEYERTLEAVGSATRADALLADRARRVARLDIRPLAPADRDRMLEAWRRVQALFVDDPPRAVTEADQLIGDAMRTRGYPVEDDFDRRAEDLSVHHPVVVQHYRAGRELMVRHRRGLAGTEDLRQAMVHIRALFEELVAGAAAGTSPRTRRAS